MLAIESLLQVIALVAFRLHAIALSRSLLSIITKCIKRGDRVYWTARCESHETRKIAFRNCFHENASHLIIYDSRNSKIFSTFYFFVKSLPMWFWNDDEAFLQNLIKKLQRKESVSSILACVTPCAWNACKWLNVKDHGFTQRVVNFNFPILFARSLFIATLLLISLYALFHSLQINSRS